MAPQTQRKDEDHDEQPTETPQAYSAEERMAAVMERLVSIQEAQPIPQVPLGKAKIVTPWNPQGKPETARPKLTRKTWMNGHPCSEMMMTEEEIRLMNQLKPGKYQDKRWVVVHSDGDGESEMFLYIPNKTLSDRVAVQEKARSITEICQLIIAEQKAPKSTE